MHKKTCIFYSSLLRAFLQGDAKNSITEWINTALAFHQLYSFNPNLEARPDEQNATKGAALSNGIEKAGDHGIQSTLHGMYLYYAFYKMQH